jgi:hypothetical protein
MNIETTIKARFRIETTDDYVEVDKSCETVCLTLDGEGSDLTTNAVKDQREYLLALAEALTLAADEFQGV